MTRVVLKIGGSLLDLPDLGSRLSTLAGRFPEHRFLLFPGGGDAADLVRGWQPRFGWSDAVAHAVAVAALDFNAEMLSHVVSGACVVRDREAAEQAWRTQAMAILAPQRFLSREELLDDSAAFPHTWEVTSDSLAAWTAWKWPAEELWLCKSVPCPTDWDVAVQENVLDPYFAKLIAGIPCLRWCDLRGDRQLHEWQPARSASAGSP